MLLMIMLMVVMFHGHYLFVVGDPAEVVVRPPLPKVKYLSIYPSAICLAVNQRSTFTTSRVLCAFFYPDV